MDAAPVGLEMSSNRVMVKQEHADKWLSSARLGLELLDERQKALKAMEENDGNRPGGPYPFNLSLVHHEATNSLKVLCVHWRIITDHALDGRVCKVDDDSGVVSYPNMTKKAVDLHTATIVHPNFGVKIAKPKDARAVLPNRVMLLKHRWETYLRCANGVDAAPCFVCRQMQLPLLRKRRPCDSAGAPQKADDAAAGDVVVASSKDCVDEVDEEIKADVGVGEDAATEYVEDSTTCPLCLVSSHIFCSRQFLDQLTKTQMPSQKWRDESVPKELRQYFCALCRRFLRIT